RPAASLGSGLAKARRASGSGSLPCRQVSTAARAPPSVPVTQTPSPVFAPRRERARVARPTTVIATLHAGPPDRSPPRTTPPGAHPPRQRPPSTRSAASAWSLAVPPPPPASRSPRLRPQRDRTEQPRQRASQFQPGGATPVGNEPLRRKRRC